MNEWIQRMNKSMSQCSTKLRFPPWQSLPLAHWQPSAYVVLAPVGPLASWRTKPSPSQSFRPSTAPLDSSRTSFCGLVTSLDLEIPQLVSKDSSLFLTQNCPRKKLHPWVCVSAELLWKLLGWRPLTPQGGAPGKPESVMEWGGLVRSWLQEFFFKISLLKCALRQ